MEAMHESMRQLEARLQAQCARLSRRQAHLSTASAAVDSLAASEAAERDSSLEAAVQVRQGEALACCHPARLHTKCTIAQRQGLLRRWWEIPITDEGRQLVLVINFEG